MTIVAATIKGQKRPLEVELRGRPKKGESTDQARRRKIAAARKNSSYNK